MHYYKKNIGDYSKKAGRLSMLQHGAYNLLMDSCYDREEFPTLEMAIDWTWASSQEEVDAVKFVLAKFFVLEGEVYVQKRIQEELDEYQNLRNTNAENGKKGGRPKGSGKKPKETQSVIEETQSVNLESKSKPNESEVGQNKTLTTNHKPITTNQEPNNSMSFPKGKTCPQQEIVDLYHEILPELPRIVKWSSADQAQLRARWNEGEGHQSMEFWKAYFEAVRTSDWHMGKSNDWKANLRWLTKQANFNKMIERFVNDGTWS